MHGAELVAILEHAVFGPNFATALVAAAKLLLAELERGRAIDAQTLRTAMTAGFGRSDTEGAWDWKTGYDACEAAQVLFLRRFGPAMRARAGSPPALLPMLAKIAALLPSHTRRSEESQALQQFSTPITLGFVANIAALPVPAAQMASGNVTSICTNADCSTTAPITSWSTTF